MSALISFLLPHPMILVSARIKYPLPMAYALADVNARIVLQLASFVENLLKNKFGIDSPKVIVGDDLSFSVYPETDLSLIARMIDSFISAP